MATKLTIFANKLLGSHGTSTRDGWAAGGTAGAFTVVTDAAAKLETEDYLESVMAIKAAATPLALLSEFSITGQNAVTNAGGTNTTGYLLHFVWTQVRNR